MSFLKAKKQTKPLRFSTSYHYPHSSLLTESAEAILDRVQSSRHFRDATIDQYALPKNTIVIGSNRPLSISKWDQVFPSEITKNLTEWEKLQSCAANHKVKLQILKTKTSCKAVRVRKNNKVHYFINRNQLGFHDWLLQPEPHYGLKK